MSWQFAEQERDNLNSLKIDRLRTGPIDVIAQRSLILECYIRGFNSAHNQWMHGLRAFLTENGVTQQQLRNVQDVQSALCVLNEVVRVADPIPSNYDTHGAE